MADRRLQRSFAAALLASLTMSATAQVRVPVRPLHDERPVPAADEPFAAAQDGIDWLAFALCDWTTGSADVPDCTSGAVSSCFGCHSQGETVLGLARSTARCFTVPDTPCVVPGDESPLESAVRHVASAQRKDCILGDFEIACGGLGFTPDDPRTRDGFPPDLGSIGVFPPCGSNALPTEPPAPLIQTVHGGLNLSGYARHVSDRYSAELLALSDWLLGAQQADGRFVADRFEAPVDQGDVFATGAAVLSLVTAESFAPGVQVAGIASATDWLRSAVLVTNQDKSFAAIALAESGLPAADPDLTRIRADLADDQRPDGSWSERAGLEGNAYATGQAVHALVESGSDHDDPRVCDGIDWLVREQNDDGSWSIGLQGVSTDSTRNSDFTATTWPVLALGSLRAFGADAGPDQLGETCLDSHAFTVEITNTADSVCGRYPRLDSFDLSVVNDLGDPVRVEPESLEIGAGESESVQVYWTRASGLSRSVTTLTMGSLGGLAADCPRSATTQLVVEGAADVPAPAMPITMLLDRNGDVLRFRWELLPLPVSGHEVLRLGCAARDDCAVRPTHERFDAAGAHRSLGPFERELLLPREAAIDREESLVFWKLRALSPCLALPGPSCNYPGCSHPERCDPSCP